MATRTAALVRMAPPRPQAPIIRVSAPRAAAKPKKRHRARGGAAHGKTKLFGVAIAAAALGYIDKQQTPIPTIPLLGRAGSIAAALYFFAPKHGMWNDAMIAAAAVAGYELGNKGSISGDVSPQVTVRGLASQV